MQNHASLTYGRLYAKLKELGFQEYRVELEGRRGRVFEHGTFAGSMLTLPERDPSALVEPFYSEKVLAKLKSLGLLPEVNPLTTETASE